MTHSWRFKSAVTVGACAAVGAIGGISAGAAAPSHDVSEARGPKQQASCPAPASIAIGGPPMALLTLGGPPVHAVEVVPNKAGNSFDTITHDSGTVKSVSGNKLTITEGTEKATYATPTLTIPADATIQRNEESAKLSDIQSGDHVDVVSSSDGTTNVFAVDSGHWPPKPQVAGPIAKQAGPPPLPPGAPVLKQGPLAPPRGPRALLAKGGVVIRCSFRAP